MLPQPVKCQCCPHIETSQMIFTANQLTGFYMRATPAPNGLSTFEDSQYIKDTLLPIVQKMRFSIKDFFSKCKRIWSHLLEKYLMENFIFCAVTLSTYAYSQYIDNVSFP